MSTGMGTRAVRVLGVASLALLVAASIAMVLAVEGDARATEPLPSSTDLSIVENYPDQNRHSATFLVADSDKPAGSGKDQSALIEWDLSRVPPGTKVGSASVTLTIADPSPKPFEAYALKRSWAESEATWNAFAEGQSWEIAGANGSPDREAQSAGAITPSTMGEQTFALSAELVQRWVDDPSTNMGIVLDDSGNGDGVAVFSGEAVSESQRPRLTVDLASTPLGQHDPVLVGAGDIAACNSSGDEATAKLLDDIEGTVFTVGDNVYEKGTTSEFANCYDPTWGRHKARTKPSVGNHEYETPDAGGYFGYFGAAAGDPARGYYSYDRGNWHIVVLNSECTFVGGCALEDPQIEWLKQDLSENPTACTLAYWHTPLYSSSAYGYAPRMQTAWEVLSSAGTEVVLNGHAHFYERFAPMEPDGDLNHESGIREFVVGTGGYYEHSLATVQPNSEVRNASTPGVLKLTLHPTSYDWEFVPVAGETFTDTGSQRCH